MSGSHITKRTPAIHDAVAAAQDSLTRLHLRQIAIRVHDAIRGWSQNPPPPPITPPQTLGELCLSDVERHNRHKSWPVEWYVFLWGQEGTVSTDGRRWQSGILAFPISIMPNDLAALRRAMYRRHA